MNNLSAVSVTNKVAHSNSQHPNLYAHMDLNSFGGKGFLSFFSKSKKKEDNQAVEPIIGNESIIGEGEIAERANQSVILSNDSQEKNLETKSAHVAKKSFGRQDVHEDIQEETLEDAPKKSFFAKICDCFKRKEKANPLMESTSSEDKFEDVAKDTLQEKLIAN